MARTHTTGGRCQRCNAKLNLVSLTCDECAERKRRKHALAIEAKKKSIKRRGRLDNRQRRTAMQRGY